MNYTVLQVDREAAADLMEKLFGGVSGMESDLDWANTVRAGEDDEYPTVAAFAAHREQSAADLLEALIAIRDMKNSTEMTYVDAYDSMFKSGGRDAWNLLDAAIAKATKA